PNRRRGDGLPHFFAHVLVGPEAHSMRPSHPRLPRELPHLVWVRIADDPFAVEAAGRKCLLRREAELRIVLVHPSERLVDGPAKGVPVDLRGGPGRTSAVHRTPSRGHLSSPPPAAAPRYARHLRLRRSASSRSRPTSPPTSSSPA